MRQLSLFIHNYASTAKNSRACLTSHSGSISLGVITHTYTRVHCLLVTHTDTLHVHMPTRVSTNAVFFGFWYVVQLCWAGLKLCTYTSDTR